MVPVRESHIDVLVAGGGTAGVCAAISAAMCGAQVRVIEQNGFFGGTLVSGIVGGFCGIFERRLPHREPDLTVGGVGLAIMDRVEALGGRSALCRSPLFDTYRYDSCILPLVLDELVLQYGVLPTLHTTIIDAGGAAGRVDWVETASKSGRERIFPRFVIDATGDADLVFMTGGAYRKNAAELQPASFNFRMSGVDESRGGVPSMAQLGGVVRAAVEAGEKVTFTRADPMILNGPNWFDVVCGFSRITVDATDTDDLTRAELEGRRQVLPTADWLRKHIPAFRDARISGLPSHIGVRETRVICGEETLTRSDVLSARKRPDGVGRCAWPIERHIAGKPQAELVPMEEGTYYDLPFGMMVPQGYQNLLVAGRASSADRGANASARVFGPCSILGQAAGTAAALCLEQSLQDVRRLNMEDLRALLAAKGAKI